MPSLLRVTGDWEGVDAHPLLLAAALSAAFDGVVVEQPSAASAAALKEYAHALRPADRPDPDAFVVPLPVTAVVHEASLRLAVETRSPPAVVPADALSRYEWYRFRTRLTQNGRPEDLVAVDAGGLPPPPPGLTYLTRPDPLRPSFALALAGAALAAVGRDADGRTSVTPVGGIFPFKMNEGVAYDPAEDPRAWQAGLICEHAVRGYWAAKAGDLRGLGAAVDAAWAVEREAQPVTPARTRADLAYAAARAAGSPGGRPTAGGLVTLEAAP